MCASLPCTSGWSNIRQAVTSRSNSAFGSRPRCVRLEQMTGQQPLHTLVRGALAGNEAKQKQLFPDARVEDLWHSGCKERLLFRSEIEARAGQGVHEGFHAEAVACEQ